MEGKNLTEDLARMESKKSSKKKNERKWKIKRKRGGRRRC